MKEQSIEKAYELAREVYATVGVDTEAALARMDELPISLQCWQGDDVTGYEPVGDVASQNVVTGSYPGRARNGDELRADLDKVFSLSPCKAKVNLHTIYAEPTVSKDRKDFRFEDYSRFVDWAKEKGYGLDFNTSFFTHPMMDNGLSLASPKKEVRDYWIEVGRQSRIIADKIGRAVGQRCINNTWIPDGLKDMPASRFSYRENLMDSLDKMFADSFDQTYSGDVLEGKLFGIGVESFTVGSHELYMGYAVKHGLGICLDTGHFHPTESVADKISAYMPYVSPLLLHVSRGIRWDSDHVVVQGDELQGIMNEIKRGDLFGKVYIGLDYFDASINRIAAWTIGLRAASKSMLTALLEPSDMIIKSEQEGDFTTRLALMDEVKNLPAEAVWNMACLRKGVPVAFDYLKEIKAYERDVLSNRD